MGCATVLYDRASYEPRDDAVLIAADAFHLPMTERSLTECDLEGMSRARYDTCSNVPLARWDMDLVDSRRFNAAAQRRTRYGSFLQSDFAAFDSTMFRISPAEARPLEPQ